MEQSQEQLDEQALAQTQENIEKEEPQPQPDPLDQAFDEEEESPPAVDADAFLEELQKQYEDEPEEEPQPQPQVSPEQEQSRQLTEENRNLKTQLYDVRRKWGGIIGELEKIGPDEATVLQRTQQARQTPQVGQTYPGVPPSEITSSGYPATQQPQPFIPQPPPQPNMELQELKQKIESLEQGTAQSREDAEITAELSKVNLQDDPYAHGVIKSRIKSGNTTVAQEARAYNRYIRESFKGMIQAARDELKRKQEESIESSSGLGGSPMLIPEEEEAQSPQKVETADDAQKNLDAILGRYQR